MVTQGQEVKVVFSEADRKPNLQEAAVAEIARARQSIYLITMTFSSETIRNALIGARRRGVDVALICDWKQYEDNPRMRADATTGFGKA